MSMQKLAAGTGYAYLTKQVARQDVAERGHVTLASYYSERGEVPGVWVGSGMAAIDGLAAGDVVTPEHMRALFGAGLHPLAELPAPRFEGEQPTAEQIRGARMIGQPFRGATVTAFQREVADRLDAATQGRTLDRTAQAALLADIRTQVATDGFVAEHGRRPSELELSAHLARELKAPSGVAGFDLTFSPVKSVSALWALADPSTAAIVERAHQAAIGDALRMIEQHALFTRVGKGGAYQVETRGLVAAAFTHRDSRAGDPDLHTHVVVANKVQTRDGRWLSLDARVLYKAKVAASETYNTAMEARLQAALSVRFAPRDGGERLVNQGKRAVRELVGVSPELVQEWSARRRAIEHRTDELAADFQRRHGRVPTSNEQLALAQQANLETRDVKHEPRTLAEQRRMWRAQANNLLGRGGVDAMLSTVLRQPQARAREFDERWLHTAARQVVRVLEDHRAVWGPWHVRAEAQRLAREQDVPLAQLDDVVEQVIDLSLNTHSVQLRAAEDGAGTALYSSTRILDAEQRLIDQADIFDAPQLPSSLVEAAIEASPVPLNLGQQALVRELATSGQRLQVALAPAGTGKTTAVTALANAWTAAGGNVLGLAPSAAAAQQLGDHLPGACDTLAKYRWTLDNLDRPRPEWWEQVDRRTLVIVDEAAMASTPLLADVVGNLTSRGATVRMLGDDQQLAAIGAGGIVRDLAERNQAPRLDQAVRFSDPQEAAAVAKIREGNPVGLRFYLANGRVHEGAGTLAYTQMVDAWASDRAAGKNSIMLASTRDDVALLNHLAQRQLMGERRRGRLIQFGDGTRVGAGDRIITRRNDRGLALSGSDWVKNGDRWTVDEVRRDGSLVVTSERNGRRTTLPVNYAAEHVQLGYASTIHTAQGLTADTSHTLLTGDESRQQLYTAITRGRDQNHLHCTTPENGAVVTACMTATERLAEITRRNERLSTAHSILTTVAANRKTRPIPVPPPTAPRQPSSLGR